MVSALVTAIEIDSAAAEAGLRPGDVIQEIDRQPVKDASNAAKLAANEGNNRTLLRVWSNGGSHYIVVDVVVDESAKTG